MANFFNKTFQFFNRIVTISEDKSTGLIKYGAKNDFPQQLISQLNESPTASACIEKLSQYIFAEGLTDETIANLPVNNKQTLNEIISENSRVIAPFRGIALHVSRKTDGSVGMVKTVPFEQVRKKESGDYVVNPTFGTKKVDNKKDRVFPAFKGIKIHPTHISAEGEILYYFTKKPLQYDYPIPSYYAGIEDINTDSELSKYELETVVNSFNTSGILQLVGQIDDTIEDKNGKTEWDYLNDSLSEFTGAVKDSTGASGRQSLLVLHRKTKEELAVFTPTSNEAILNASENATKRIRNKVAMSFGVPPFLIGADGTVGFATNIISDNIELFNSHVYQIQEELLTPFRMLFPLLELKLTQLTPIKYLPPEVYAKLTDAEIREIGGYETEEAIEHKTKIDVANVDSIVSIIQNTSLTPNQKINSLEILFGMSNEDAIRLVGDTSITGILDNEIKNLK